MSCVMVAACPEDLSCYVCLVTIKSTWHEPSDTRKKRWNQTDVDWHETDDSRWTNASGVEL